MDDGRRRELEALENYVERWIGFGEAMGSPLPNQLEGDLFGMVDIGVRLTDEEIRRAPRAPAVEGAWDGFIEVLATIRGEAQASPAELRAALSRFRATLR